MSNEEEKGRRERITVREKKKIEMKNERNKEKIKEEIEEK